MVQKITLENGRSTWGDTSNPEVLKNIEQQFNSKIALIDGKPTDKLIDLMANAHNKIVDLQDDLKKAKSRSDKEEVKRINTQIKVTKFAKKTIKNIVNSSTKAEHGIKFERYDDESYPSQYNWLVKTITKFFGQMNINRSSADWGGIDNWTIKGGMYEGIFIIIDDDNKVFLMERKHNEETDEYENTDLAEAEPSETKELEFLFEKAMSIKEGKLGYGGTAESSEPMPGEVLLGGTMLSSIPHSDQTMKTGGRFEKAKEMARISMKPYAFKQKAQFLKENPEMLAGKFFDNGGEVEKWIGSYKKPIKTSDVSKFLNSTKNDGHKYSLWNKDVGVTYAYNGKLYANNGQKLPNGAVIDLGKVMSYWEKNKTDTLLLEDEELVVLPEKQDKYNCYTTGYDGIKTKYGNEDNLTLGEAVEFCWYFNDVKKKYETKEDLEKEIKSIPYGKDNVIASKGNVTGVVVYKLANKQYAKGGGIDNEYYVTYASSKKGFDLYSTDENENSEMFIGNYEKLEQANKIAEKKGLKKKPMYNRYAIGGGVGEDKLELFYVMDNNGNVKNISKSYEKANDFLEKSLKLNGKIGYKYVLKSDWDAEKINASNIKKYANGGGVGMTNESLYSLVEKTPHAIKVSDRPDMYSNLTKQSVINMANSMSYYERMDNDEPEITTFEKAKKAIELEGDWKVVKIAKHGTGTEISEIYFLSKDRSGRGEPPIILPKSHILKTWDLEQIDDYGETTLKEFMENSEPGDTFIFEAEYLENIGTPNIKTFKTGGIFDGNEQPIYMDEEENQMLHNALLISASKNKESDFYVSWLIEGNQYVVDWFGDETQGSQSWHETYPQAKKHFDSVIEFIKRTYEIKEVKMDVPEAQFLINN